jgi:geranylgeranyl pyrophosphate synthase
MVRTLDLPGNLAGAIEYAALGPGKRIRPLLAWHACVAAGAPGDRSLPAGAAVEFIHAFSLVHDDLPALDNDDLRRGRATLHIHAGEAMAILAGDALMALAFDVLARHVAEPTLAGVLVAELSAATTGMIAGQVYDTLGGLPPELGERQRLELIHKNKTGALIRSACRMGAILGIADGVLHATGARGVGLPLMVPTGQVLGDPRLRAITTYAEHVGLMFQIVDDLLDAVGKPEHTGKRTRKDAAAGKATYPALLGVDGSRREVDRLRDEALAALEPIGAPAEGLRTLCRTLAERRK